MRSPLALAWRLHRGLLTAWTTSVALIGLIMGGVAQNIVKMVEDNTSVRDVFVRLGGSGAMVDSYLASTMILFGLMVSGYAIQATLKLRAEEASGRAEPVLATVVGRMRWAASHLALSVLGSALLLAVAGLATGLAYGGSAGHIGHVLTRVVPAALAELPAVWLLAALTIALVGLLPRLAPGAWGVLAAFLLLAMVGTAMQWNAHVLEISPFAHVPKVPGGAFSATPLIWLTLLALAITATGLMALRRRDIPIA